MFTKSLARGRKTVITMVKKCKYREIFRKVSKIQFDASKQIYIYVKGGKKYQVLTSKEIVREAIYIHVFNRKSASFLIKKKRSLSIINFGLMALSVNSQCVSFSQL